MPALITEKMLSDQGGRSHTQHLSFYGLDGTEYDHRSTVGWKLVQEAAETAFDHHRRLEILLDSRSLLCFVARSVRSSIARLILLQDFLGQESSA